VRTERGFTRTEREPSRSQKKDRRASIMKFTFTDWKFIQHSMEVARRQYEELMNNCNPSEEEHSGYQVFKRHVDNTTAIIDKITNAEI
jgi:predicted patatin/cPLA2 family phospholipase